VGNATNAVNELRFAMRQALEMHAPQSTSLLRDVEALPCKLRVEAGGSEFLAAEQAGEGAAAILMSFQPHRDQPINPSDLEAQPAYSDSVE
jgi:hypothetical protein